MRAREPGLGPLPERILFIGKRFYTNKDALEERFGRIYQLPRHWAGRLRQVHLWLIDYHTRQGRRIDEGGLPVSSTPVFGLFWIGELFAALFRFRPAVVVASGDCYIGLLGWLVARLTGARFVFDIYDKYDEFGAYARPLGWDLFGFLRRHSDLRFYAAATLAAYFEGSARGGASTIVPNGVDTDAFRPLDPASCRARLGLEPDFVYVGYFGSLLTERGPGDLVAAAERLQRDIPGLRLLMCGVPTDAVARPESWLVYRGSVPHQEMPLYLNACDVLVIPYRRSLLVDTSSSCKIAEYLAVRRPIVSTRTPNFTGNFAAQAALLGDGLCNPEDPDDLARAIAWQLRQRRLLPAPSEHAWQAIADLALAAIRNC